MKDPINEINDDNISLKKLDMKLISSSYHSVEE